MQNGESNLCTKTNGKLLENGIFFFNQTSSYQ